MKSGFWKQWQRDIREAGCYPLAICSSGLGFQLNDNRPFIYDEALRCGCAGVTYPTIG